MTLTKKILFAVVAAVIVAVIFSFAITVAIVSAFASTAFFTITRSRDIFGGFFIMFLVFAILDILATTYSIIKTNNIINFTVTSGAIIACIR